MQDEWKLPASAGVTIALSGARVGSIIGERFDPGFGRSSERCVLRLAPRMWERPGRQALQMKKTRHLEDSGVLQFGGS